MLKLFSFYNQDLLILNAFIFVFIIGSFFYLFKFHKELITKNILKVLLILCGISTVFLLVFNYLKDNPTGDTYYTKFNDAGTLSKGSNVIYRGVNVGQVTSVSITPDSRYALVEFIVTDKNTKIPVKSHTEMSFRSITDMQPLIIKPPTSKDNYNFVISKSFIESRESVTVEETEKLISKMIKEGKIEDMINDLGQLVKNSSDVSKSLNITLIETVSLVKSVKNTNENINKVIQNGDISNTLKSTVNKANITVKKFETVADKTNIVIDKSRNMIDLIQNTVDKADQNINNENLHTNIQDSAKTLKQVLLDIQEISGDPVNKKHLKNSISKVSDISSQASCLTESISQMMGKRFLIPRLIIGKPAQNINQCTQQMQLELQEINNK